MPVHHIVLVLILAPAMEWADMKQRYSTLCNSPMSERLIAALDV